MSDLFGKGFGDCHDWKKGDTNQSDCPWLRSTYWECKRCKINFYHDYHAISDIFEAMKRAGITDYCGDKNEVVL